MVAVGGRAAGLARGRREANLCLSRAFPGLPKVLHALRSTGSPTIVFGGCDAKLRDQFAAPSLRFETRRLDLKEVAAQCDLAVLSGGQATTLALLLAGKPILQAPLFLEQALNAMATVRLGAGLIAFPGGVDRTGEQIAELLGSPQYTDAARKFEAKYAGFSPEAEITGPSSGSTSWRLRSA